MLKLIFILLVASCSWGNSFFISADLYESIKGKMPKPPEKNSQQQKNEEKEILRWQNTRTTQQCQQAKNEAKADLKSLFGPPAGPLTETQIDTVSEFLLRVRGDIGPFVGGLKKDFPRQRPHLQMKNVNPCVEKDDSGAFPSGHGTLSKLYAMILTELLPSLKEKLERRAIEIGENRIIAGAHFSSDIESGRTLADLLYPEFTKSEKYQDEIKRIKKSLSP
jgi:acid phosphatase (class A)